MKEIDALATQGRIRNRLLTGKALQGELRSAARRVMHMSKAGTPERLLTLQAIADESGLQAGAIVDAILEAAHEEPT